MTTEKQKESKIAGTYVYCVLPSAELPKDLAGLGPSIDQPKPLRTVRSNGLVALVSDAMRAEYDASRANVGVHERVIRDLFEKGDVLPMRFGSVARDDAMVKRFLTDKQTDLEKSFEQLHGRGELAVKALWDQNRMLRELVSANEQIRTLRDALAGQPEAETRDQRIELGRLVGEAMDQMRQAVADRILQQLRPKALDVELHRTADPMVLNAAFLVDRNALDDFDAAVNELIRAEQGRLTIKYLGPLPPYSFVRLVVPKEA
jgi:hypothetical protein